MKSFSQSSREAPVVVVREVWAVMSSAVQMHSWLGTLEARNLKRSSVLSCIRTMSRWRGVELNCVTLAPGGGAEYE